MSQEENAVETAGTAVARPKVRVSECLQFLKDGMTRKEIAAHYGVPMSVMAEKVWSHPELKGKKTKKIYDLDFIDDSPVAEETVETVVEEEEVADVTAIETVEEEVVAEEEVAVNQTSALEPEPWQ